MAKKKSSGLVLDPSTGELRPVTRSQKIQQWIYGFTEPLILRFTDFMLATPERARQFNKTPTPKALPREVVVTAEAACRFIDFIYSQQLENDSARMAVTKCVCQTATNKFREPVEKDMALLYTADMYTSLRHTGIKEPYRLIETAEEAKEMIRYFDECRLVHTVMYCHSSGKWTFVMCNCDDELCIGTRCWPVPRSSPWTGRNARAVMSAAPVWTGASSTATPRERTAGAPWTLPNASAAACASPPAPPEPGG